MTCHRTYSLHRGPDGYTVQVTERLLGHDAQLPRPGPAPHQAPAAAAPANPPSNLIQIGPLDC